jgi:hypothetical protein
MLSTCKSDVQESDGDWQEISADVKSVLFVFWNKTRNSMVLVTADLWQKLYDGKEGIMHQ